MYTKHLVNKSLNRKIFHALFLLMSPGLASSAAATAPPSLFDGIWNSTKLYDNTNNQNIQSFSLVGRYHGQYWSVDADQGQADEWDNRRIIFGFNTKLFHDFKFEIQMHINESFSPVYEGLYVGFLEWAPKERDISVALGRLDYVYTGLERSTSSKKITTFERGLLVNQLLPGEVFGLYSKGDMNDKISFQAGLFSGATTDDDAFADFDSGQAALLGLNSKLPLFMKEGKLHLDYLYNDGDHRNSSFEDYRHVVSIWHQGSTGALNLGVDLTLGGASFEGKSNVWGLSILPTYDLKQNWLLNGDALQLALRYQYARSTDTNGLDLPRRYEREVASGEGDRYQAFYLGFNYLINGHKLKLMAGAEYSQMDDSAQDGGAYRGWTYLAGVRLYF